MNTNFYLKLTTRIEAVTQGVVPGEHIERINLLDIPVEHREKVMRLMTPCIRQTRDIPIMYMRNVPGKQEFVLNDQDVEKSIVDHAIAMEALSAKMDEIMLTACREEDIADDVSWMRVLRPEQVALFEQGVRNQKKKERDEEAYEAAVDLLQKQAAGELDGCSGNLRLDGNMFWYGIDAAREATDYIKELFSRRDVYIHSSVDKYFAQQLYVLQHGTDEEIAELEVVSLDLVNSCRKEKATHIKKAQQEALKRLRLAWLKENMPSVARKVEDGYDCTREIKKRWFAAIVDEVHGMFDPEAVCSQYDDDDSADSLQDRTSPGDAAYDLEKRLNEREGFSDAKVKWATYTSDPISEYYDGLETREEIVVFDVACPWQPTNKDFLSIEIRSDKFDR